MVNLELNELLSNLNGTDFELVLPSKFNAYADPYLYSKERDMIISWDFDGNQSFTISAGGYVLNELTLIGDVCNFVSKHQTLESVKTKLTAMYKSYNESDFSSPDYEIPEKITEALLENVVCTKSEYWKLNFKVLEVVRYIWDDEMINLYLHNQPTDTFGGVTQSDVEYTFELILNK
jgi:hypothetical protein